MDEATKAIAAFDVGRASTGERDRVYRVIGRSLAEALMRPDTVVVIGELGQYALRMPLAKDQQVVEHLATDGADPALGDRVGSRRPVGQADDLDEWPRTIRISRRRRTTA